MIELELNWPPSVNHYWKRGNRGNMYVDVKGRQFRTATMLTVTQTKAEKFNKDKRLAVKIELYPPDARRRDVDNIAKAVLDSLEHAGVYVNDSQVDSLFIVRKAEKLNKCVVSVSEMSDTGYHLSSVRKPATNFAC